LGTLPWTPVSYEFTVRENKKDVVLVCELRANKGEASFDLKSLILRKLPLDVPPDGSAPEPIPRVPQR
jgi:hypothetical protein